MTSSYRSVNSPMFCGVTKPKEGYCSGPSAAVPRLTWISESRFTTHAVVDAVGKVARDFHGKYRANLRLSFRAAKNLSCRATIGRSEEHTSELQSQSNLVCRLLLEKKKQQKLIDTVNYTNNVHT